MTIQERASQWVKHYLEKGYSQSSLAKKWGVSPTYINNIKNKKDSIGIEAIKRILNFDKELNPRWLIFGEGQMYLSTEMWERHQERTSKLASFGYAKDIMDEFEEYSPPYKKKPEYPEDFEDLAALTYLLVQRVELLESKLDACLSKKANPTKATKDK